MYEFLAGAFIGFIASMGVVIAVLDHAMEKEDSQECERYGNDNCG